MARENMSQEFRLKNIYETRNDFIKEINQSELIIKKYKTVSTVLNYIKHLIVLASAVTAFGIWIRITSSAGGIKIFAFLAGIKKV